MILYFKERLVTLAADRKGESESGPAPVRQFSTRNQTRAVKKGACVTMTDHLLSRSTLAAVSAAAVASL